MRTRPSLPLLTIALAVLLPSLAGAATGVTGPGSTPAPVPTAETTPNGPGMFRMWNCRTPNGTAAPLDGWIVGPGVTSLGADLRCEEDGAFGPWAGPEYGAMDTGIAWVPASGIQPVSVRLQRAARTWIDAGAVGSANAGLDAQRYGTFLFNGVEMPTINNTFSERAVGGSATAQLIGVTGDPTAPANRLAIDPLPSGEKNVAPLAVMARCSASFVGCDARYRIYAADFRLRDPAAPTAEATSGQLTDALRTTDQRPVSGSLSFAVAASDAGTGVRQAVVEVDGEAAATSSVDNVVPTCRAQTATDGLPAYTVMRPCPAGTSLAGQLDSTRLADGQHAVRILVKDAADNTTVAASGTILTRNSDRIGPGSPLALRGAANGSPATDSASLVVLWPATGRRASTRRSTVRRCQQAKYAAKHPLSCKGRPASSTATTGWSATRAFSGQVTLRGTDGQPIAGATIELVATPIASGAAARTLPSVTTDAAGTATFTAPLTDGSRAIMASWRARAQDTQSAATGTATIVVGAETSLEAPSRVGRGANVTFQGRLAGRSGDLAKVPITLEVRDGGRWKTFATAVTEPDGSWRKSLRFAMTPGRYRLRAKVGTTAGYPYAAGESSRSITVTVR